MRDGTRRAIIWLAGATRILLRNARGVGLWRWAAGMSLIALVLLAFAYVPLPQLDSWRAWSVASGHWFPVLFVVSHVVVTLFPIPRTVFTLVAGVLFGPTVGVSICVGSSTLAALITFVTVRRLGRDAVAARLSHPAVSAVNERLARRGWLAVGSLRLIAAVPFSILNYCSALSRVRLWSFLVATVVGLIPGTVAVVLLGDALTGKTDPTMLAVSAALLAVGVVGLLIDSRLPMDSPSPGEGRPGR